MSVPHPCNGSDYPFDYYIVDDSITSRSRWGMDFRDIYIKWFVTEDIRYVEEAVPVIAAFVGRCYRKLFGGKEIDRDICDPVAYTIIMKMVGYNLPLGYQITEWLKTMCKRLLLRETYPKWLPPIGDPSVRDFKFKPFITHNDVETIIFVEELIELVIKLVKTDTRLNPEEQDACGYIAETFLKRKAKVSRRVLKTKYGVPDSKQQFYIDFTKVIARNYLYKVREALPKLYGDDKPAFFGDYEYIEEEDLVDGESEAADSYF